MCCSVVRIARKGAETLERGHAAIWRTLDTPQRPRQEQGAEKMNQNGASTRKPRAVNEEKKVKAVRKDSAEVKAPKRARARKVIKLPSSDEIHDRIMAAIMEHKLPPGTQLVEERLARIFNVSRTKVREAIGRLVHDQIATNIPNRGAFVSSPTSQEARDVFFARRLIEPTLVRSVAQTATPKQVAQLRAHIEREKTARSSGAPHEIIPLSGEFHILLAQISGNSFLVRTLRELESLTALIIILYDAPDEHHCPYDDHPLLVDAIEAHDADRAAELMTRHLEHVEHSLKLEPPESSEVDLESVFS
jgi:DNA-binding GntR family transcriptional regulator